MRYWFLRILIGMKSIRLFKDLLEKIEEWKEKYEEKKEEKRQNEILIPQLWEGWLPGNKIKEERLKEKTKTDSELNWEWQKMCHAGLVSASNLWDHSPAAAGS